MCVGSFFCSAFQPDDEPLSACLSCSMSVHQKAYLHRLNSHVLYRTIPFRTIFIVIVGLCLIVVLIAAVLLVARCLPMASAWQHGAGSQVSVARGLAALPSRYLHDVHEVVARQPMASRMHASLAGGLLAALALFLIGLVLPSSSWLGDLTLVMLAVAGYGLLLEYQRRRNPPAHLSRGRYQRLPVLFLAVWVFLASMTLLRWAPGTAVFQSLAWLAAAVGLYGLGGLAWYAGNGPMRHVVAGLTYLAAHPRPQRFGAEGRSSELRPLDLASDRLGVNRIDDFSWPQLASFDACVQCGRCEQACPAFAAGQPLNPKKFINDLAANLRGPEAFEYAGQGHPGQAAALKASHEASLVIDPEGEVGLAPETLWSCTTCRACVEACPMMIEHVDAMIDLRRSEVMEHGRIGEHAQSVLENLQSTATQGGQALTSRFDWAVDLNLPTLAERGQVEILLWVGEAAFDRRSQRTLRALVRLLQQAGVDFAVLGDEERDSGDQARRLGDEATFQTLARANIATLAQYRFDCIVTADPHALHVLRNEYPAFGGDYRVRHHSDLLDELLQGKRLQPSRRLGKKITYHDPCYLGRYNGEFEAPRRLLDALGVEVVEMSRSRSRSHCCGGGGGAPLVDVPGERRIPDMRMAQVDETGAGCVAVACPGCTAMLEGVTNARAEVRDVAELLWSSMEGAA